MALVWLLLPGCRTLPAFRFSVRLARPGTAPVQIRSFNAVPLEPSAVKVGFKRSVGLQRTSRRFCIASSLHILEREP